MMGLLQSALETYDFMASYVGMEQENLETLAPIGHIIAKAMIEITLDSGGSFIQAKAVEEKIIIPVTEESAGRTSAPAAHPLCDNIGYILPMDENKHQLYLDQLNDWAESEFGDPKLTAITAYLSRGSITDDLSAGKLLQYDDKGKLKNEKDIICWRVIGMGARSGPVWNDQTLIGKYIEYYKVKHSNDRKALCMISGETDIPANSHLKGVVALNGNAKIVSSNDKQNFTYLGRFINDVEALSISYSASQRAHNALKWVVANQKDVEGGRVFVCWNPHGLTVPKPASPLLKRGEETPKPSDYRAKLKRVIEGYRETLPQGEGVVIASFEAATAGRLAVTYYNELQGSDYIARLGYWDETCSWYDNRWGTSSPLLYEIICFAFGTLRGEKMEVDPRITGQHMQRLISCRVDRARFPADIMHAIVQKAGNLQIYKDKMRSKLLFAACAVVRKYHIDHFKEEWDMALDIQRADRSYQFGRWLAIMEKIERDTYDKSESREPNAIRMQSVFVQRPGYASRIIMDQLKNAYYQRLSVTARIFYDRLIGQIMEILSRFPQSEYNKALTETYLMGYYLQKNELYTKKEQEGNTEGNEDEV